MNPSELSLLRLVRQLMGSADSDRGFLTKTVVLLRLVMTVTNLKDPKKVRQ
jgi:hypothetical protein